MDVSFENLAYGAAGVVLLALFVWSWFGSSRAARWWVRRNDLAPNIAMGIVPGVGLLLVSVVAYDVFGSSVIAIAAPIGLLAFPVGLIGFSFPQLWAPRWFKQIRRGWKLQEKKRS